jgi:ribosomal protein L11 methyltransferase
MDSYHILEVSGVSIAREEMVTFDLFEAGAQGVQENLVFEQKQRHYQPDVIETSVKNLIVYFADLPSQEWLQDFVKKYPELSIQSSEHQVVDWLSEWKKSWKAFELCPGYWVVPDWKKENFDSSLGKAIYIEPGMAFGTGTHATTQIASSFLVPFLKQTPIESLVDVGTGSGILCFFS